MLQSKAALLDLAYREDSRAAFDCNIVRTDGGAYVEVQGSAEAAPIAPAQLDTLLELAARGIEMLFAAQRAALGQGS
jgi:ribonuclease PH